MPELPEVETMRRGILGVVGSTISHVSRTRCRRKPILVQPGLATFRRRAEGRQITTVDRVGKRVVIRLEGGDSIVFEPRMTGLVLLDDWPSDEHLRFYLQLAGGQVDRLWYWDRRGLGSIRLLTPRQFDRQFGPEKLGPDALRLTADQLREQLRLSRREIKPALLDQRAVAGIGNLYASEILHAAGVDPRARCHRLARDQWRLIHTALSNVLNTAIYYEGSTLADGTYRNAFNKAGGYQNHHRVYDRAGLACPSCQVGTVMRIVQTQRATFFCPACQRKSPRRHET